MGVDPITAGIAAGASYFGGRGERSRANEAARQERALMDSIIAQAEAVYGPAATEAAIQKAIEDIAKEYETQRVGVERGLYARGMGERTPGAMARLASESAKQRLAARRDITAAYPLALLQAKTGIMPQMGQYAERMGGEAAGATMLPFQLMSGYQGMKTQADLSDYIKNALKTPGAASDVGGGAGILSGGFAPGWSSLAGQAYTGNRLPTYTK